MLSVFLTGVGIKDLFEFSMLTELWLAGLPNEGTLPLTDCSLPLQNIQELLHGLMT